MKERDREERGTGMKVKKQKKLKYSSSTLTCYLCTTQSPPNSNLFYFSAVMRNSPITTPIIEMHHYVGGDLTMRKKHSLAEYLLVTGDLVTLIINRASDERNIQINSFLISP